MTLATYIIDPPKLSRRRWYIRWRERYEDPYKWELLSEHPRDFIRDERETASAWRNQGFTCMVLSDAEVREVQG